MEVDKLEIIKFSSSDVIIELLHHVPGPVPHTNQHDRQRQLAGLHDGGHCGGLVLHLTVGNDDKDVEDVVALHDVPHGSPDDGGEAGWSTKDDSPHRLVIFLHQVFEVPAGSALSLQADVEDTPVLSLSVSEPVAVDGVDVSERLESFSDDIYDFLVGIVDRARPRDVTMREVAELPPSLPPSHLTG